jgi:hypothetical protein
MSDFNVEPPKQPDRAEPRKKPDPWAEFLAGVARRAVLVGVIVGGLVGLGLGAIVLNIVGCRREAAIQREHQRVLDEWQAEQDRKQEEERRWRTP